MLFRRAALKNVDCFNFLLPVFLGLLPFAVIFIGEKPIPFYVVLLLILFVFEKNKKSNLLNSKKLMTPFLVYIGVYLIFSLISDDISISSKHLERQASILIIPLLIFSSNWTWRRLTIFFETVLIVLVLVCLLGFLKLGLFHFVWSDWIVSLEAEYLQFKFPHLLNVHPTYWSYLLIFGNSILLYNGILKIEMNKYFFRLSLILFNLCLLLLAARTALVINFVLLLYFCFVLIRSKNRNKRHLVFLVVLSAVLLFFVFQYMPFVVAKITAIPNDERLLLWPKALDEIRNNYFIWGEGVGHGTELLKEHVSQIEDYRVNYHGFDLHNQYLRNYLDMGILGFAALLNLVWSPILMRPKESSINIISLAVCLLFFIGMLTESSLSVLKGIVFLAVVFPMVMVIDKHYCNIKGVSQ